MEIARARHGETGIQRRAKEGEKERTPLSRCYNQGIFPQGKGGKRKEVCRRFCCGASSCTVEMGEKGEGMGGVPFYRGSSYQRKKKGRKKREWLPQIRKGLKGSPRPVGKKQKEEELRETRRFYCLCNQREEEGKGGASGMASPILVGKRAMIVSHGGRRGIPHLPPRYGWKKERSNSFSGARWP